MKKIALLLVAALLLVGYSVKAQKQDTLRIKIGNKSIIVIEDDDDTIIKITTDSLTENEDVVISEQSDIRFDIDIDNDDDHKFEGHWAGFEFGFNGLMNKDNEIPNKNNWMSVRQARSWTFGINLFQKDIPIIKENFGIVSGLGMKWVNYHFTNNIDLTKDGDIVTGVVNNDIDYTKNRLQEFLVTGMLGFELQFPVGNDDDELFILAGGYGGYKLGSNYMRKWEIDDNKEKQKVKDDYHLSDLEYGLTARIGVGDINLFANYSLTPLFKEDTADAFYPVTVGIMIVGF